MLNEFQQQEQTVQFLMGLNDSFTHIRGHILLMEPMPPTNKILALILQEEQQNSLATSKTDSAALPSKPNSLSRAPRRQPNYQRK